MALQFESKARNLMALSNVLKSAKILPLMLTSANELKHAQKTVINRILDFAILYNATSLIIRSSSRNEDSSSCSNAGAFLSLSNIPLQTNAILEACLKVGNSMPSEDDEICIQPMLTSISMCGVCFSVDKDNFAPYFCVQYDTSGQNHAITDGSNKDNLTFTHFRDAPLPKNPRFAKILKMMQELEVLFDCNHLDVEFAYSDHLGKESLFCLQVRPLVMKGKPNVFKALSLKDLEQLKKRLIYLQSSCNDVLGDRAIFGVMSDWNPAEIIGLHPKRLALSLYKEMVTDNIWAYQRDNYGYRNLRSHPLMHSFLGVPYIDVRLSFNSFIPKDLDEKIARKLSNYYATRLLESPALHDKIEFEIVFSCYDFHIKERLKTLLNVGFNENECKRIEFSLLNLTNTMINPREGLYMQDLQKIKKLYRIYTEIKDSKLYVIDKIYWLLEHCKRYGTLPFAGIARAAFVATQMLHSLVEIGFFTREQKDNFLNALKTVNKELSHFVAILSPENKACFLKQFGHLRAGTYNILSPRYDEAFDMYFAKAHSMALKEEAHFILSKSQHKALNDLLCEHGLKIDAKAFLRFCKSAIEGRERAKFEFSRLLSYAIFLIGELGEGYHIAKEDMAHLDIKDILTLYSCHYFENPKILFMREIALHKKEYERTLALKLPPLIRDANEVLSFYEFHIHPNFITQKNVMAEVVFIDNNDTKVGLDGKIALIRAADPGYDYLFAAHIVGLITCYGGSNSHMAVRASELGLPAVIGVGERAFAKYTAHKTLCIDCENEQILCL